MSPQVALASAKTDKGAVTRALRKAEALLREMVGITLRQDLTRIQRISLETCITVHMHQKESSGVPCMTFVLACPLYLHLLFKGICSFAGCPSSRS